MIKLAAAVDSNSFFFALFQMKKWPWQGRMDA